jgi:hypothetical protein
MRLKCFTAVSYLLFVVGVYAVGSMLAPTSAVAREATGCEGEQLGASGASVEADGALCMGTLRLNLVSWGDKAHSVEAGPPGLVARDGQGARWQQRVGLEEWHKAQAGGVSQGWVVHKPLHTAQHELLLTLEAPGATARSLNEQSVVWEDGQGQPLLNYGGLVAWDQTGRLLDARMEARSGQLRIRVDVERAVWPVTVDPIATASIFSPTLQAEQQFSSAIAAHKDMLAVGAYGVDGGGRVYIFRPTAPGSAQWNLVQEINGRIDASDPEVNGFGGALDMDDEWLVVGSLATGVSIYQLQPNGSWVLFKHIKSTASFVTNGIYNSNLLKLGTHVKLINDYLFVTSIADVTDPSTGGIIVNSGIVAVYHRNTPSTNDWGRVNVIFDTVPAVNKNFGTSISGTGDWLFISSKRNDYVSIFKKSIGTPHAWVEDEKIQLPPTLTPRNSGTYVSSSDMSKNSLAIGIPNEGNIVSNRTIATNSVIGAVYYYELDELIQKWTYKQSIQPDTVAPYRSRFGASVKIEGKTLAIGTPYSAYTQPNVLYKNPVFIFKQARDGSWTEDFLTTSLRATKSLGTRVFLTDGVLYASDLDHNEPASSSVASVGAVHIRDFNTAPSVLPQQLRVMEGESGSLVLDVYDTEQEELEVTLVQGPMRGSFQLVDGVLDYTAEQGGRPYTESLTYKVSDGKLETMGSVSIEVVNVNDAPSATPQQLVTAEDTSLMVTLGGDDPDEGTQLTFEVVGQPSHGALMGQGATRTYIPSADFSGEDSFTFKVSDGMLESQEAQVRITITPVDDPPVFVEPLHEGVTRSEDGAPIELTFAAMDVDSQDLVWSATGLPTGASFENGRFVWTPAEAQQGMHSFDVKISDGNTEVKRTKQLVVVFNDVNMNGIPDVRERALVAGLDGDADEDGDGIRNADELGDPLSPNDTDRDGTLDVFDKDSDADGISDKVEAGDEDLQTPPVDSDNDGIPDFQQVDADGDGVGDGRDNCLRISNADQADRDENGIGDACDTQDSLDFQGSRSDDGGCSSAGLAPSPRGSGACALMLLWSMVALVRGRRQRAAPQSR